MRKSWAGVAAVVAAVVAAQAPVARATAPVFGRHWTPAGTTSLGYGSVEPSVSADPDVPGTVYVMQAIGTTVSVWRTTDLGASHTALTSFAGSTDVDVAVGDDGTVYATTLVTPKARVHVAEDGTTFAASADTPRPPDPVTGAAFGVDRQWVVADPVAPGTAWMSWIDNGDNSRQYVGKVSKASGTWTVSDVVVATTDQAHKAGPLAAGTVDSPSGPVGTVYFAYHALDGLRVARRVAGGTWQTTLVAPVAGEVASFPVVGADRHGRVYATWSDHVTVWFAVSTDGGATFGSPVALNDPTAHAGTFPTLAVRPSGAVAVAYYEADRATVAKVAPADTEWHVAVATNPAPYGTGTWQYADASGGTMHRGSLTAVGLRDANCGLGDPLSRRLADDFEVTVDAGGNVVVAYPRDAADPAATCKVDFEVAYQTAGDTLP